MTTTFTAFIFESAMTATAGTSCRPIFSADRPASFAAADRELARHSLIRTTPWELADRGGLTAQARVMDNVFNGVRAVDLWDKVGTTHSEFKLAPATTVENGDLITDSEKSEVYLVAGSSAEGMGYKIHQVADGKEWADRFTGYFPGLVWVARQR